MDINKLSMAINKLGQKIRVVNVILILLVSAIMGMVLWCNCAGGVYEGFSAAKSITGSILDYSMGNGVKGSWDTSSTKGTYTSNDWYKSFESNTGGTVPLPDGKLSMFYDNTSSPDCCPSTYSTSTGCVCATSEQMKYLNKRGGNRTLTSIY